MRKIILMCLAALLLISPASAFDIVRDDKEAWACVDYAVWQLRDSFIMQ